MYQNTDSMPAVFVTIGLGMRGAVDARMAMESGSHRRHGSFPTHPGANLPPYLGCRAGLYRQDTPMSPTIADSHLLTTWQHQRDTESFRVLCERHLGLVEAASRRAGSPDVAEAVQAVYLVLVHPSLC